MVPTSVWFGADGISLGEEGREEGEERERVARTETECFGSHVGYETGVIADVEDCY